MRRTISLLFLLCGAVLHTHLIAEVEGREWRSFALSLKEKVIFPDGVRKNALLFNDMFPGPLIVVERGEHVQITVTNHLREPTSVHWHGFFQNGTQFEDGPAMVTQCPLTPTFSQKYSFAADRSGTFWYHSHYHSQYTDGLVGGFIVRDPEDPWRFGYDDEIALLLSDWYHTTHKENTAFFLSNGVPPFPFSALINGRGMFPCSSFTNVRQKTHNTPLITPNCFKEKQSRPVYRVVPGKTYRLRVINVSSMSAFMFSVDGHKLRVIETDGVSTVTSAPIDYVVIATGQRYSFLLTADRPVDRYLIRSVMQTAFKPVKNINAHADETLRRVATAVLIYDPTAPVQSEEGWEHLSYAEYGNYSREKQTRTNPDYLEDLKLLPLDGTIAPATADVKLTLDIKLAKTTPPRTSFNGKPFVLPQSEPLLFTTIRGEALPANANPINVQLMQTVQIVINNNQPYHHPIHLHGHTFHVVARGYPNAGAFKPERDALSMRTVKRDVVILNANSWVVIRFLADNPGVWSLHCHIDWHNVGGMVMTLVEGQDYLMSRGLITPEARRVCKIYNSEYTSRNPAPSLIDYTRSANPSFKHSSPSLSAGDRMEVPVDQLYNSDKSAFPSDMNFVMDGFD